MLVSPTTPTTAFPIGEKVDDPLAMYLNDLSTIPANLAGIAGDVGAVRARRGHGLPVGLQIMAPALGDDRLYRVGAAYEAARDADDDVPLIQRVPPGGLPMSAPTLVDFAEVVERFDPVLGLEVHVELSTHSKMFCGCPTEFGAEPNTQVCPVCLGLPGSLPVVNRARRRVGDPDRPRAELRDRAVGPVRAEELLLPGHAEELPDLPVRRADRRRRLVGRAAGRRHDVRVEIERAHMEEDTGKSLHVGGATGRIHGAEYSLLDYNRAGVPLIEIVTKPIPGHAQRRPRRSRAYVTALRDLLRALGVSDVRMEQGSLRCDANLSLMPRGSGVLGTRTETKNVNSLRSVERAVRYEMTRQAGVLLGGGPVVQETRHFDEATGTTRAGRRKETAEDYRYFPEPDLVPIAPPASGWTELRATLPELPWQRRARVQASGAQRPRAPRPGQRRARSTWSPTPSPPGPHPPRPGRGGGPTWPSRPTPAASSWPRLPITPAQVARVIELVDGAR